MDSFDIDRIRNRFLPPVTQPPPRYRGVPQSASEDADDRAIETIEKLWATYGGGEGTVKHDDFAYVAAIVRHLLVEARRARQ